MKAEERRHLKENELAERLGRAWRTLASGSTLNTIIWGAILVGLALAIGWRYYSASQFRGTSAEWTAVEDAASADELREIIKKHAGTAAARIASFHLTRYQMNAALSRVAGTGGSERTKAADELVEVRDRYAALAKEAKEPELIQEALMGVAKAEEVLAAVPKADNAKQPRGSLDEAEKEYKELAKRYPDSYLGKQAAKRAAELADHKSQIRGFYDGLMEAHSPDKPPPPLVPAVPGPSTAPGPDLPEAPKAPPPAEAPKPSPPAAGPADKSTPPAAPAPPNPPTSNPSGINPAEVPNQPKPKGP
jgi:hypothetical protein